MHNASRHLSPIAMALTAAMVFMIGLASPAHADTTTAAPCVSHTEAYIAGSNVGGSTRLLSVKARLVRFSKSRVVANTRTRVEVRAHATIGATVTRIECRDGQAWRYGGFWATATDSRTRTYTEAVRVVVTRARDRSTAAQWSKSKRAAIQFARSRAQSVARDRASHTAWTGSAQAAWDKALAAGAAKAQEACGCPVPPPALPVPPTF